MGSSSMAWSPDSTSPGKDEDTAQTGSSMFDCVGRTTRVTHPHPWRPSPAATDLSRDFTVLLVGAASADGSGNDAHGSAPRLASGDVVTWFLLRS